MGWYTGGPGGLSYKYGDVLALARSCGLGSLLAIPRLSVEDEEDIIDVDELVFLGALQEKALAMGLPWVACLGFDPATDPYGEGFGVALDVDVDALLDELVDCVDENILNIVAVMHAVVEDTGELTEEDIDIVAGFDFAWSLPEEDAPRLLAWLNEALRGEAADITLEALDAGAMVDGDWYEPPPELREAFAIINEYDDARYLALQALACARVSGEDLVLDQPDDDYQVIAWGDAGETGEDEEAGAFSREDG